MNNKDTSRVASPNFAFLAKHSEVLVRYGAQAERYVFDDPNTALIKLRQFAELLAQQTAAYARVTVAEDASQLDVLNGLCDARVVTGDVSSLFHGLRKAGNDAVHRHSGTRSEALHQLRMARTLAVWFHRVFGKDPHFKAGPFVPPPDPSEMENELATELTRLRQLLSEQQQEVEAVKAVAQTEAELRELAEQEAKTAYQDLEAALELAEESEGILREKFQQQLAAAQEAALAAPADTQQQVAQQAQEAAETLDLDEQATRKLIDAQLHENGWEVNSELLTYGQGARPQKGKHLAIAEWPTSNGPADYVLFVGLTPVAVVEAKRKRKDVPAAIEQAKRYSEGYRLQGDQLSPGGPWGSFTVPFLFATNGRPYLKQIKTKSGIWFLDGRVTTNHPRALEGWYTPPGLSKLLKQDLAAAEQKLKTEPSDYLPLREFQHNAVLAVEDAIANGRRELLLAMATGTGKTRTCIGIVYRLIKANGSSGCCSWSTARRWANRRPTLSRTYDWRTTSRFPTSTTSRGCRTSLPSRQPSCKWPRSRAW